jgi:hypothetical protein
MSIMFSNAPQFVVTILAVRTFGYRLFYKFKEVEKRSAFITIGFFIDALFGKIVWIAFSVMGIITLTHSNPDLNPEIRKFLADAPPPAPEDNNAAYAFMGMYAPLGTKDTYEWGKTAHKKLTRSDFNKLIDISCFEKTFAKFEDKDDLLRSVSKNLWDNKHHDYNRSVLKELGLANKEMLDRYFEIYKYDQLSNGIKGQQPINAQRYILADAVYKAIDGNADEAFDIWKRDFNAHKNFIGTAGGLASKAVTLVFVGRSLIHFNELLVYAPQLASARYDEIKQTIKPLEIQDWNMKLLEVSEYKYSINAALASLNTEHIKTINEAAPTPSLINDYKATLLQCIAYDPITFKNIAYELSMDRLSLSNMAPSEAREAADPTLRKYYDVEPWDALYHVAVCDGYGILDLVFPGMARGAELTISAYTKNAQMRALNVLLDIKAKNIARADVAEFIKNSPAEYYDPFTEKPIAWDEEKGSMFVACEKTITGKDGKPDYENMGCREIKVFLD